MTRNRPASKAPQAIDRLLHETETRLDTRLRAEERENAIARDAAQTRFQELALLTRMLNDRQAETQRREADLRAAHAAQLAEQQASHDAQMAEA
ncbi:MAG: hypothetical protein R3D85_04020, partial [Paracoccaceae bacterium]